VFLIILFSFVVPLFPTGGWNSPRDWVLPTVTLALAPMGIIARFTRASMLEVIRADFTLTARAKGLGERAVIFKHALKNAFIPVVTLLGPMFAAVGTGDRKSTRLNSSHVAISYAVFCLKKKKITQATSSNFRYV